MTLRLSPALTFLRRIPPVAVAWLILLGLLAWFGQQSLALWTDPEIPTDAIQAQQIRVKTGQLQSFIVTIKAYQAPAKHQSVPADRFGPAPSGN